jgi:hypothetical protein
MAVMHSGLTHPDPVRTGLRSTTLSAEIGKEGGCNFGAGVDCKILQLIWVENGDRILSVCHFVSKCVTYFS